MNKHKTNDISPLPVFFFHHAITSDDFRRQTEGFRRSYNTFLSCVQRN